jgi:AcrR family transcriptional regulator
VNPTAERLLKTAERLYALEGLDKVSTRHIAREAGQKNHSALQYHFGNQRELIEAILDYRMMPLNKLRQPQLKKLKREGRQRDIRLLVELIVSPFAQELLKPPQESYYISLLMQLCSRHQESIAWGEDRLRAGGINEISELIISALGDIPEQRLTQRLTWMGVQIIHAVGEWDFQRRQNTLLLNNDNLDALVADLVDYLVGGLSAPVSSRVCRSMVAE